MVSSFVAFVEGLLGVRERPPVAPASPGKYVEYGTERALRLLERTARGLAR